MGQRVHVIRHGEVENPKKILYGRQPGWSLSERGKAMAEGLGEWSKSIEIGALHVSPLQRAQETATPISVINGIPITTDERLIEAKNVFEGHPIDVGFSSLDLAPFMESVATILGRTIRGTSKSNAGRNF
jgi:broad specificity phosphatase PhoE